LALVSETQINTKAKPKIWESLLISGKTAFPYCWEE